MQRILLTLLLLILATTTGYAQQGQRITLQEAIQIALDNNFALKQAENSLVQAENSVLSEKADFLPSFNSSLGGSINSGQQFIPEIFQFGNFTSKGINGRIGANYNVFNGFNNILTLRQSEATKLSREESLNRQKEDIIFNTTRNFLQVLLDVQQLENANQNLETSKTLLGQTKAQVEVGTLPIVDQYNQESTVATNELTVTQRENALALSKLILVRQLQIDPLVDYDFVVPDLKTDEASLVAQNFNLRDLVNTALDNRSDLKSQEHNVKSQEYQMKVAKWAQLPSLSVGGSIFTSYSDQSRDPVTRELVPFNDQFFDRQVRKGASFTLNIPLFSNLQRRTSFLNSKISYKNAELGLEDIRLNIIQQVTQEYNQYLNFAKELESNRAALVAAEKAFESEQERYNVGASTFVQLNNAQTQYQNALSNYTSTTYQFIFQTLVMDYYLGQLDENISLD